MKIKKNKILVIEEDLVLSKSLVMLLKKNNYAVSAALTGKDGLRQAYKDTPNLIICDIMLPDIDGYAILEKLKENKETKLLPFIFLTAKVEMRDLRKGMNLGADDYLTKPFRVNDLLNSIEIRLSANKSTNLKDSNKLDTKSIISSSEFVLLDIGNNKFPIKVNQITCILSKGNYTFIYMEDGKKYTLRKILKEWQSILSETNFIRIHRSTIINLNHVKKIQKSINNTLNVQLNNYENQLTISRRYRKYLNKNMIT